MYRLYLLKNGDQLIVETYDHMLHRLNINNNDEHSIVEKNGSLVFGMDNAGRTFKIYTKDS